MLDPDGWPNVDEDELTARADSLSKLLRVVTSSLDRWFHETADTSTGAIWSGRAANAGASATATTRVEIVASQSALVRTINWMNSPSAGVLDRKTGA